MDASGRVVTTDPRISIVVADDHPLYRDGLVNAINAREDLELVGQADDGAGALELISERRPDVALLDVKMDVDGPTVLRRAQNAGASTKVVFLSAYLDSALIYSDPGGRCGRLPFKARGALGYLRCACRSGKRRDRPVTGDPDRPWTGNSLERARQSPSTNASRAGGARPRCRRVVGRAHRRALIPESRHGQNASGPPLRQTGSVGPQRRGG